MNGAATRKDDAESAPPDEVRAAPSTDSTSTLPVDKASELTASSQGETDDINKRGLNSTLIDEKPADVVTKGNCGADKAVSVA